MNPLDPELTLIGALPEDSTEPASIRNSVAPQPTETAGGNSFSEITEPQRAIELVRGSRHRLDDETQELLHERLRAVTIVLFIAVFVFWIRNLFLADAPVLGMQGLASGILIASVWLLSSGRRWSLNFLRRAEVGLFWSTAAFLCTYQFVLLRHKAHLGDAMGALGAMKSCVIYFFGVIILYGTFIPNRWQRAVKVIGPMALVPGIIPLTLRNIDPQVRAISQHVATFEQISDNILMLLLGVMTSAYGTAVINSFREEAYKARQLGQYRLKELLGKGGMGEVYLAEHRLLKRKCAIKLIRPDHQRDPQARARFEREVRATAGLSHPNTIDVYDYGHTDDGTFFYAMEFLPGMNLSEMVKTYGPLPAERAVSLLTQTCGALREAHDVGLIHRDIKPANIFSAHRGGQHDVAKLLDFGLVQTTQQKTPQHESGDESAINEAQSTTSPGLCGSIHFMAPEQADPDQEADQRSDIYSLGATAYFLVTGQPPFVRDHGLQVLRAHAEDAVTPPSLLAPDLPRDVEAIILKCLAKSPDDRFRTVSELETALTHCSVANRWTPEKATDWWKTLQHQTLEEMRQRSI